ncbi:hypothetical protein FRX31_004568 [Thalictrum thalictroides]|uniref:Uncharacterized protein n=1 Tax=Thalictrum thalictroides TaxID=46969 RepID=A0A7J6X800_THATH|nr:hypothetical protein FRX31_004568 [Thalictrum thalictroides]
MIPSSKRDKEKQNKKPATSHQRPTSVAGGLDLLKLCPVEQWWEERRLKNEILMIKNDATRIIVL